MTHYGWCKRKQMNMRDERRFYPTLGLTQTTTQRSHIAHASDVHSSVKQRTPHLARRVLCNTSAKDYSQSSLKSLELLGSAIQADKRTILSRSLLTTKKSFASRWNRRALRLAESAGP